MFARRALFQVHLWVGVSTGLYIFVVCATGAALVFRIDLQRTLHPELFTASAGEPADAATILDRVRNAYPDDRVSGIDAPTTARPTYLAYVIRGERFLTLLVDPVTGKVLGELPERSFVRTLQDLHFDLLAGRTGRIVNGIGAVFLLTMCVTGLVIWWPGVGTWRRGFRIDFRRSWKRVSWETHSAIGIWAVAVIAMWAVTGIYFAFPSQFRSTVNWISPLTVRTTPVSSLPPNAAPRPTWRALVARAQQLHRDQHVARVVVPSNDRAAFLVMFSPVRPTRLGGTDLTSVYLDQYTGQPLLEPAHRARSAGDIVIDWVAPLHVGNFAGLGVRIAWLMLGLAPPLMFVTGFIMWWTRVVGPKVSSGGRLALRSEIPGSARM